MTSAVLEVFTCEGAEATIVGTEENDVLVGTMDVDVIVGLGGEDEISGKGGDDLICGNCIHSVLP